MCAIVLRIARVTFRRARSASDPARRSRPRKPVARLQGFDRPWWWQPNRAALLRVVECAGFAIEEATRVYFVPNGYGHPRPPRRSLPRKLGSPQGREELIVALRGVPHVAVLARPA